MSTPKCPFCNSLKKVVEHGDRNHYCGGCRREFNVEPGENSVACVDPVRSLELKERHTKNYGTRYDRPNVKR
jgi:transposase-like protein